MVEQSTYRVLRGWSFDALEREVNEHIRDGWAPQGGPTPTPDGGNWTQAVVRRSSNNAINDTPAYTTYPMVYALQVALQDDASADAQLRYIVSEVGETADAHAVEVGESTKSLTESSTAEAVDVMLAAIGFIAAKNRTLSPQQLAGIINRIMAAKSKKWLEKLTEKSK